MKKNITLVELVRSMSATEKRYVSIFSEKHLQKKGNKYLHIFEQLQKTDGKKSMETPSSASDLNYLYRFILKAMRSFHEGKDVRFRLRELLSDSQFLYEKRLYVQSLKQLDEAKALAIKFERHHQLLEILQLEACIVIEHDAKQPLERLSIIHSQVKKTIGQMEEDSHFIMRQQRVFLMQRMRFHIPENERDQFLVESAPEQGKSDRFTTRYHALFTHALYYHCLADYPNCLIAYEELITLWNDYPERLKEESMQYKKILSNYLSICHRLSRFDRFPEIIARIKEIPCRNQEEEAEQFQNLQLLELLYLMNTDGYDQLNKLAKETSNGLERYRTKINKARALTFYYNFAVAYFLVHDWQASLSWLAPVINENRMLHRQDIQLFSRMFRLVLWYELGKHDLLEYELINVERFLKRKKSWSEFESVLFRLLNHLVKYDGEHVLESFMKYRDQLDTLKKEKASVGLGMEELYYWAVSHITNQPMRILIRTEYHPNDTQS